MTKLIMTLILIVGIEIFFQLGGTAYDAPTMARTGEKVIIRKISGNDDIRRHLATLGFVVDTMILVVSQMAGNLIVEVKGSRVALDKSMARRIFI